MRSPLRGLSIAMMVVLSVAACKRRSDTQGAPGDPAPAPAPVAAPGPGGAHDAAAALPWVTGPACDADLDATLDVPCLHTWATPAGPTPLVVHLDDLQELRLVAQLDGARTQVVHLPDVNVARGTRLYLRPQLDQRLAVVLVEDFSEDGTEPVTAAAWLLSRTGKTIEVTSIDREKEPWPAWASATPDPAATAAAAAGPTPRPTPVPGCTAVLTTPEQVCACVAKLLREGEDSLGDDACEVHETLADSARIGQVTASGEGDDTYFVMHRVGAGWAALFILGAPSTGGAISTRYEVAASRTQTSGSRQALWIEVEDTEVDIEDGPRVKAQTTRSLALCLLGEAGAPSCVLEAPLSGEQRDGRLPDEIWASPAEPSDHVDELRVVSSYRLRVDVSDDGRATIAVVKGEPPEDVRPLLGTHTLW